MMRTPTFETRPFRVILGTMPSSWLGFIFLLHSMLAVPQGPGTLEGRLLLPDGKPAAGVRIAVTPAESPNSQEGPPLLSIDMTDAEGRYKLVAIPPGRYYLVAGLTDRLTYYPGGESPAGATVMTIGSTTAANGLTFSLSRALGFDIRGRVIADSTESATRPRISLSSTELSYGARFDTLPREDGSFEFIDIRPGTYLLGVSFPNRGGVAIQSIAIDDRDLTGVELRILRQIEVSGRILVRSNGPVPPDVLVQAELPSTFAGTDQQRLADSVQRSQGMRTVLPASDGFFKLVLAEGEHQIVVRRLPADYEVQSIQYGPQDLRSQTLRLEGNARSEIAIVIAPKNTSAVPR